MDLDRAQTEWTLGLVHSHDLPELAAQMMVQGFDSPAILELASFHRPATGVVPEELVRRAFQDCGRSPLSPKTAVYVRVASLLRSERRPSEVLSELCHLDSYSQLAYGDGPLSELAGLAEDWNAARNDPLMRMALEDHVPAAGQRFLDALGKSS